LHHSVAAAAAAAASVYVLPSYEFNPMMESPPNANAREIPQNHILTLSSSSSTSAASSSHLTGGGGGGRSTAVAAASNSFPNDIAELLNDPVAAAAETRRFREYHHTTTNNGNNTMGHSPQHPHFNLNHPSIICSHNINNTRLLKAMKMFIISIMLLLPPPALTVRSRDEAAAVTVPPRMRTGS
jgi:hypothetical protein